ncbi:hypothetical protein D3C74_257830 [compost metagenome]
MVVAFDSADHEQLLVKLRRLRESEKFARMHAARHKIIARAFRRALGQDRSFYFNKSFSVKEIAEHLSRFGAQPQRLLHFRTAQVEVTVFQAQRFIDFDAVFNEERRRFRCIQHFNFRNLHFDVTGWQIRIDRFGVPGYDFPRDGQHVFAAYPVGDLQRFSGISRIKDNLYDTAAITQIDEQDAPQVAAGLHPAV